MSAGFHTWTHLSHKVHVRTQDSLEPLSFLQELGHGSVVLPHVFLTLLLPIEQFGQVVPEAEVHLKATQSTVKPLDRTGQDSTGQTIGVRQAMGNLEAYSGKLRK